MSDANRKPLVDAPESETQNRVAVRGKGLPKHVKVAGPARGRWWRAIGEPPLIERDFSGNKERVLVLSPPRDRQRVSLSHGGQSGQP